MTDLATLQSRLGEAENAYHLAVTGGKEVSVNIDGYGAVTYQTADAPKLCLPESWHHGCHLRDLLIAI